jgi:hypothetical protein
VHFRHARIAARRTRHRRALMPSAYGSIRQHTSACAHTARRARHGSALQQEWQHTAAYGSIRQYICTSGVSWPERCGDNISPSTSAIETAREKGLSARRGGVEGLLRSGLPELRFLLRFELFAFKAFLASCQGQDRETGARGLQ